MRWNERGEADFDPPSKGDAILASFGRHHVNGLGYLQFFNFVKIDFV